jgi:hypothetical protein
MEPLSPDAFWRAERVNGDVLVRSRAVTLRFLRERAADPALLTTLEVMDEARLAIANGGPAALDPEHEAIYGAYLQYALPSAAVQMTAMWLRVGGPALALEALLGAERARYAINGERYPDDDLTLEASRIFATHTGSTSRIERYAQVRRALVSCTDAEASAAEAVAERVRTRGWTAARCLLAFTFPHRTDWAADAVAACLALAGRAVPECAIALLGAGASAASKNAILRALSGRARAHATDILPTTLDMDGLEVVDGLVALYDADAPIDAAPSGLRLRYSAELSRVLAVMQHEAVAASFARRLDAFDAPPKVELAYLKKVPELAVPALRPVVARWDEEAPLAKALLRELEAAHPGIGAPAVVESPSAGSSEPSSGAVVDRDALPRALGRPPWRSGKGASKAPRGLPFFWTPLSYTPIELSGSLAGRTLPVDVLDDVAHMLRLSDEGLHEGLRALAEVATRESLEAFFGDAIAAWEQAQGKPKDGYLLRGLCLCEGPTTADRLEEKILPWFMRSYHQRVELAIDVLCRMRSEHALAVLGRLLRFTSYPTLVQKARDALAAVAVAEGVTVEDLLDRQLKLEGLDAPVVLSYGARSFEVGFDATLRAYVRDEGGGRLDALPKPGKRDDPEQAEAARARWKAMRAKLDEEVGHLADRMERGMLEARRWTHGTFTDLVLAHPVLSRVAQCVVWARYDSAGRVAQTFRVDESLELVDEDETTLTAKVYADIGIVHPVELDDATLAVWRTRFGDYQILQPFAQLGRAFHRVDAAAVEARLRALRQASVSVYELFGLERRLGWKRVQTYGRPVTGYRKALVHASHVGRSIELSIDPCFTPGDESSYVPQRIAHVRCDADGPLHPIERSELWVDLADLGTRA